MTQGRNLFDTSIMFTFGEACNLCFLRVEHTLKAIFLFFIFYTAQGCNAKQTFLVLILSAVFKTHVTHHRPGIFVTTLLLALKCILHMMSACGVLVALHAPRVYFSCA